MSKLGKLFKRGGSSRGRAAPSPQEALARLRETEEMLGKKQEYLEARIRRELSLARTHGARNKPAALQALKRKKRLEKQLSQIDGTLSTVEFQREALENAHTNTEVLRSMGLAARAMRAAHADTDLNKIDDLMQEITEQQDVAQEISEAISQRAGLGEDFDEDELLAELEELEQEELNKKMTNIRLPSVPSSSLPAQPVRTPGPAGTAPRPRAAPSRRAGGEDADLQHLAAWAS
ncbi:charged multivesicular body protein 4c [Pipistrellus kuhlii]|uniref:Charged multivesicular body protein 4C n=1 Tax=Pipistrellus kuhlii TaxID=59472 RepID=A0A7J7VM92_PIPKU|nr:charged multivesicular body protein 4c [Pipistrellus kuhlii]KAF6326183.1 charged multivesicular body protein 4C [Pipistrellus kuhlii]